MPRGRGHGRGRRRHGGAEEGSGERWLLTYADMITLLMALFMVLFSISSVNISKYQTLQKSLKAAFSGNILPGGKAIAQQGATDNAATDARQRRTAGDRAGRHRRLQQPAEQHVARRLHQHCDRQLSERGRSRRQAGRGQQPGGGVRAHQAASSTPTQRRTASPRASRPRSNSAGWSSGCSPTICCSPPARRRSKARADGLLGEIAQLLNVDETHPISVEGNTDNVPIHSSQFPSNWELSTARASTVVRFLIAHGVGANRLTASGNAEQRPVDSNATAAGRARNRRVEIVMRRLHGAEGEGEPASETEP